jgi:ATP-dependent DNA ligase
MLAASATAPFESDDHLFEVKWDGTRALAFVEADTLRLLNRRRVDMRGRYPELECLRRLPSGTVLDGEIVVLEKERPSFTGLLRREMLTDPGDIKRAMKRLPATLVAFDVLYERGESTMDEPLADRKQRLVQRIDGLSDPHIANSEWVVGDGIAFLEQMKALELEGMMAKRLAGTYRPGKRSTDWLKIKIAQTECFDVIGYVPHESGKWMSSLLVGQPATAGGVEGWVLRASVGSGLTEAQRRDLLHELAASPPLPHKVPGGPKGSIWKQTGRRCAVRYFEKTADGKLRAPVFKGFV